MHSNWQCYDRVLIPPIAASFFIFLSVEFCAAQQLSLDRQIDCLGESTRLSTTLDYLRDSGADITYSDLEASEQLVQKWGFAFGRSIGELPQIEKDAWLSKYRSSMKLKIDGLMTMIKKIGLEESLRITRERVNECVRLEQ